MINVIHKKNDKKLKKKQGKLRSAVRPDCYFLYKEGMAIFEKC
jgi:hypothetical protein